MSEQIELRPEVLWFAEQMELTLRKNDHKGGWKHCHPDWLIHRLCTEANELYRELRKGTSSKIIFEATDVANFAMMIADVTNILNAEGHRNDRITQRQRGPYQV